MNRPDPESLLSKVNNEEAKLKRGQLKIFFGYAAGVGKTYSMLESAHMLKDSGVDVVVGYIEPHSRKETIALIDGLEVLSVKEVKYKNINLKEFDIDLALKRKPEVILVDELAHTNAKGCRHNKRWQDIEELLSFGIDVYTTVNVQHLESLNDIIEIVANVCVKETIPDKLIDLSSQLELIDVEPDVLIERFNQGKIYKKDQAKRAQENFFTKDNLVALRELALRKTAQKVNKEVEINRLSKGEASVIPTSETILVCVSPSPSSAKLIRTASRISQASLSKLIAIYIKDPIKDNLSKEANKQLESNLELAKMLGAEVVLLHGDNMVEDILRFSKMRNITKVIIGRNHKKHSLFSKLIKKDIVDNLIDEADYIDVHVIPYKGDERRKFKSKKNKNLLSKFKISNIDLIKLSVITMIATIIAYTLHRAGFIQENLYLTYMLGVVLVSVLTKGYGAGILSSVLSVLIINYLFTNPLYTFKIENHNYIITLIGFCIAGIITSTLTSRIQQQVSIYAKREQNTQMLYKLSRSFLRISNKEEIIEKGLEFLSIGLNRNVVCYLNDKKNRRLKLYKNIKDNKEESLLIDNSEKAVATWVLNNNTIAGSSTDTLPGSKGFYIPIIGINETLGVVGVSCLSEKIDNEDMILIEAVIAQMAISIDREILAEEQKEVSLEIESERLRSNLLRAISHDLRTPLAGISGAISTIIKNKNLIDEEVVDDLLNGVFEDTQWLIRLVENLLSMTRIDEGRLEVKKNPEIVEEVISESLSHIKKRMKDVELKIDIPDKILFVDMDAKLIEQVLINLIDNAIKYCKTECKINIKVYEEEEYVAFEVIDNGPGICEEFIDSVFDRFFTGEINHSDSRKGVGLGLSICKSIITAHKGTIEVKNNELKGATFKFILPKEN
ncbi:sensor histidine kinase [Paraclostridium sordellii]|uniref:sensor histidine kinase n=1 Tax=Paraclostridium sordellii TaxID=1505 RepID=UPI0005E3BDD7|nr:sensor histidine kinase KdpD [Paeniclostridium sordellii]CEQ21779.1 two-component sensor histidine kinase KdpD [[Clostridium] sordellii] [Paeniclostridium sordellii]